MTILRGGSVYAPESLGINDVALVGSVIFDVSPETTLIGLADEVIDVSNLWVTPGFVDAHVHVQGAGGRSGPESRAPELQLSELVGSGVTTAVTCMGTDTLSRTMGAVLMRAQALEREGMSAYLYTGGFGPPLPTLTGTIHSDLVLLDRVIGVKIAIAEVFGAQLQQHDVARLVGEAYLAADLSGKPCVIHMHVGDVPGGLGQVAALIGRHYAPTAAFVASHVNRSAELLSEAADFACAGGHVDLTGIQSPRLGKPRAVAPADAARTLLDSGVAAVRISMSSDSGASVRQEVDGRARYSRTTPACLMAEVRDMVRTRRIPLEVALGFVTANPARILGLAHKGQVAPGASADLLVLDSQLNVLHVIANGQFFVRDGRNLRTGGFESAH